MYKASFMIRTYNSNVPPAKRRNVLKEEVFETKSQGINWLKQQKDEHCPKVSDIEFMIGMEEKTRFRHVVGTAVVWFMIEEMES